MRLRCWMGTVVALALVASGCEEPGRAPAQEALEVADAEGATPPKEAPPETPESPALPESPESPETPAAPEAPAAPEETDEELVAEWEPAGAAEAAGERAKPAPTPPLRAHPRGGLLARYGAPLAGEEDLDTLPEHRAFWEERGYFSDLFELRGTSVARVRDRSGRTREVYFGDGEIMERRQGEYLGIDRYVRADGLALWTEDLGARRMGEQLRTLPREENGYLSKILRMVRYHYDAEGQLTTAESVLTEAHRGVGTWSFAWEQGRLTREEGPRGERRYRYDDQGRLVQARDASGRASLVRYGPRRLDVSSASGEVVFQRVDEQGRLAEAGGSGLETLRVERDPQGRVQALGGLRYHRDPPEEGRARADYALVTPWGDFEHRHGRRALEALETPAGTFRFESDLSSRQVRYPNGVVARSRIDSVGRLQRLDSSALSLQLEWSKEQRLARRERDGAATRYEYDLRGHLAAELEGERVARYRHDSVGRRLWSRDAAGERTSRYDGQGRLVARTTPAGGESFRYDEAGRLVERRHSGGIDRFGYDGFGRLSSVRRAGQPRVRYGYDALGRLASRRLGAAEATRYVYDGLRLLAEVGPGERLRLYVQGPQLDQPLAVMDEGERWTYLHADDQGTVLAYSDAEGRVVARARYDAFGRLLAGPSDLPLIYAGRPLDPVTGLIAMRARFYEPSLGRFLTPDPAGLRDGFDPFVYAQACPTDRSDPLGLYTVLGQQAAALGSLGLDAQLSLLQGLSGVYFAPKPAQQAKGAPAAPTAGAGPRRGAFGASLRRALGLPRALRAGAVKAVFASKAGRAALAALPRGWGPKLERALSEAVQRRQLGEVVAEDLRRLFVPATDELADPAGDLLRLASLARLTGQLVKAEGIENMADAIRQMSRRGAETALAVRSPHLSNVEVQAELERIRGVRAEAEEVTDALAALEHQEGSPFQVIEDSARSRAQALVRRTRAERKQLRRALEDLRGERATQRRATSSPRELLAAAKKAKVSPERLLQRYRQREAELRRKALEAEQAFRRRLAGTLPQELFWNHLAENPQRDSLYVADPAAREADLRRAQRAAQARLRKPLAYLGSWPRAGQPADFAAAQRELNAFRAQRRRAPRAKPAGKPRLNIELASSSKQEASGEVDQDGAQQKLEQLFRGPRRRSR